MSVPKSLREALRWLSDIGGSSKNVPQQFNRPLYDCTLCEPPLVSLYMATFSITEWGRDALAEPPGEPVKTRAADKTNWRDLAGCSRAHGAPAGTGKPFTSQPQLAELFGCSSSTINKAIHSSAVLKAWAESNAAIPKVVKSNAVALGCTAQNRELNPADDAAIREYLEREDLTPDERALFHSMNRECQLLHLDQLADDNDQVSGPPL